MPIVDSPTETGALNVMLNQRSATAPFHREAIGIQGDENPDKALGFDQNGVLGAIDFILTSPDGTRYRLTVANGGALSTTPV